MSDANALAFIGAGLALRWERDADRPERPVPQLHGEEPLDWGAVAALAVAHRVAGPLLAQALRHPARFAPELRQRLGMADAMVRVWAAPLTERVGEVLAGLHAAGVPAVVLKGWAFAAVFHGGDAAQRPSCDLDLLVAEGRVADAEAVLRGLGFARANLEPWPGFHRRYRNASVHAAPADGRPSLQVGLHWHLLDVPKYETVPSGELLRGAVPLPVAGAPALVPAPEDHLVYCCAHVALHHRYDAALFRRHDLALLARESRPALDWDAAVRRAERWGWVLPVRHVLAGLEGLWPGTVPSEVGARLRESRPSRSERLVHWWVSRRGRDPAADAILYAGTLRGVRRRIGFVIESAVPSPEYMRRRYCPGRAGAWPVAAAYALRPWRGLRHLVRGYRLGGSRS